MVSTGKTTVLTVETIVWTPETIVLTSKTIFLTTYTAKKTVVLAEECPPEACCRRKFLTFKEKRGWLVLIHSNGKRGVYFCIPIGLVIHTCGYTRIHSSP